MLESLGKFEEIPTMTTSWRVPFDSAKLSSGVIKGLRSSPQRATAIKKEIL